MSVEPWASLMVHLAKFESTSGNYIVDLPSGQRLAESSARVAGEWLAALATAAGWPGPFEITPNITDTAVCVELALGRLKVDVELRNGQHPFVAFRVPGHVYISVPGNGAFEDGRMLMVTVQHVTQFTV